MNQIRRLLLLPLMFFSVFAAISQTSDFLLLKKKDKTIQSYYQGSKIEFATVNNVYRNGLITSLHNDSIFIQEFLIRELPTTLGTYVFDTAGSFRYAYPIKDIAIIGPKTKKGFNLRGSGYSLFGGGILLLLGSGVVYLVDRNKFSPALAGSAAGLAFIGYLLTKTGNKGIIIGKHGYRLHYMKNS